MAKFKRAVTFLFLFVILACGLLAGCGDKYANLKVVSDKQEQGVTLYFGEEDRDTAEIVFTVEGAVEGVSTKLKEPSFETNSQTKIVEVISKVVEGASTTYTIKAIGRGHTTMIARHEESDKTCRVNIRCEIGVEGMEYKTSYNSKGIVVAGGQPLVLDTAQIIKFIPSDTTENLVTYSLKNPTQGITVTENGLMTVEKDVAGGYVTVVAKNSLRNDITPVEFQVKIVEHISDDKVNVISEGQPIKEINLVSNFETENKISLSVDVTTNEIFDIDFNLVDKLNPANHNVDFITFLSKKSPNAVLQATKSGECYLKIDVIVSGVVAKTILMPVKSIELAQQLSINGNSADYAENIYTTYSNNLGHEFNVEVGNILSADRTYFIAINAEDIDKIEIYSGDKTKINPRVKTGDSYSETFDILNNLSSFYVLGKEANSTCTISVFATSTFDLKTQTVVNITLKTLLGVESVAVNYPNEDVALKTVFVEVGKTVMLDYTVEQPNASLLGLDLVVLDKEQANGCFTYDIQDGVIHITGVSENRTSAKLTFPNLVESEVFVIFVFKTIQSVGISVESPLTTKNIAKVEYNGSVLQSFVMALGVSTQLKFAYTGSLYDLTCSAVDENQDIAVITKDGVIFTKNVGQTAISVVVTTFVSEGNGVKLVTIKHQIDLTVYIPIKDIILSSTIQTVYYLEDLNQNRYNNGDHIVELSLEMYPNNVFIGDENLSINWKSSDEEILKIQASNNQLNKTFIAQRLDSDAESTKEYIDVIVNYYGSILTERCVVNIVKPVRAEGIIVSVEDNKENKIYFDARKGLASCDYDGNLTTNNVVPAKINSTVYPQNTTDKKVIYSGYDKSIIYVDENGNVYPIGVGSTQIVVKSQDATNWHGNYSNFDGKVIDVIVADGLTENTAFRINDEQTLLSVKSDITSGNNSYFYYFANDVYLTSSIANFGSFAGVINGNNYSIYNLKFAEANKQYIFETISGTVKNLRITAHINCNINQNSIIAILTNVNEGQINNVSVNMSSFTVKNTANNNTISLVLSGAVATNNGTTENLFVNTKLNLTGNNYNSLTVGLVVAINNGKILGVNNNYFYGVGGIQQFDATGSITGQVEATNSQIGGVVGINYGTVGTNNNGSILGQGFASNLNINIPNLNNVGGMIGVNYGTLSNSLVYGDILANQNVGGLVGKNDNYTVDNNTVDGRIYTSIVELFKDAFADDVYYSIQGTDNVGGLVGYLTGYIDNSYIISYSQQSKICATNGYAGGLVGYVKNGYLNSSSANVTISANTAGGLVGYAELTTVKDCYSRGILQNATIAGKVFGEVVYYGYISTTYSTINDEYVKVDSSSTSYFAGKIDGETENENDVVLFIKNSFHLSSGTLSNNAIINDNNNGILKTADNLKDITTYQTANQGQDSFSVWNISSLKTDDMVWYINSQNNDGYPVIKYLSYLQQKPMASQLTVKRIFGNNILTDGEYIILYKDTPYNLIDLFKVETDVIGVNSSVLVSSDKDGILNNSNFNNFTQISSDKEQTATLTFMLQTNPAVNQTVKVLFTEQINHYEFTKPQITIKVGDSEKITSHIFDVKGNLVSPENYYFGTEWSWDEYLDVTNYIDDNGVRYFQNGSVFTAKQKIDQKIILNVKLYKLIDGVLVNIFGENSQSTVELTIITYKGANNIDIDKKQVSMTVLNTVILNVTIYTDNADEVLYLEANKYISFDADEKRIQFIEQPSEVKELLKLTVLSVGYKYLDNSNSVIVSKTFVLELSFLPQYQTNTVQFAQQVDTNLEFVALNGSLKHSVTMPFTAKPQNLLKIDIVHFPAGKQTTTTQNGSATTIYNPTEIPSNTLIPGQVGMLVIDLYPQYSFFDELQITTTKDANDNYINFIQVAFQDKNNVGYVELKPNAEILENGIVLYKQSNYISSNNGYLTFDGKIYVKTLVTTSVSAQTVFTVTVSAIIYQRDNNGNIIYGSNGKPIVEQVSTKKSINIVVSPNPEVKLEVVDGIQLPVKINNTVAQDYYLIAKGVPVNIKTTVKNFNSGVRYKLPANSKIKFDKDTGVLIVDKDIDNSMQYFEIVAEVSKTINGLEQQYTSMPIKFYIVDYIITDINFWNDAKTWTMGNGQVSSLSLNISYIGLAQAQEKVDLFKAEILSKLSYWSLDNPKDNTDKAHDLFTLSTTENDDYKQYIEITAKKPGVGALYLHYSFIYNNGVVDFVNSGTYETKYFNFEIAVVQIASLENPLPINTVEEFMQMKDDTSNDWILLADIEFDSYTPFDLKVKSFDGNCHTITIKSFNTSGESTEYLGLFKNISNQTIVKNVFVDYKVTGDITPAQNSQIVFGGLSAQNSGAITNSNVTYSILKDDNQPIIKFGGEYNTIGGFVGVNSGIITYSTAQGLSAITKDGNNITISNKKNFTLQSNGDLAGFVCINNNLIANSQAQYIGLNNVTTANNSAMTAGFACTNGGTISYCSVIGQLTEELSNNENTNHLEYKQSIKALSINDSRVSENRDNFAILQSKANIAGFVYRNNKQIKDAFSNIPMKTQLRTSGFVFQNSTNGSIWTSYTASYFDGKEAEDDDNTAHTAFIGTNELGEVLNDSQEIKYCYYISEQSYIELDNKFSQYATAVSYDDANTPATYVGFDISNNDDQAVWDVDLIKGYALPVLKSKINNDSLLGVGNFQRLDNGTENENNVTVYKYKYKDGIVEGSANCPYLISSAQQLLNIPVLNKTEVEKQQTAQETLYIRLINNLDFSTIDLKDLKKLQDYTFVGDFDGNGLTMSGLRVSGLETENQTVDAYQFGIFKQIGKFEYDKPTTVRSLTLSVKEFAQSTSTFAGILSGVVVNTKLKDISIDAANITVLGQNVVGGVAGIILGKSTIYNVTSNASVEAAYKGVESGNYQGSNKTPAMFTVDIIGEINANTFSAQNADKTYKIIKDKTETNSYLTLGDAKNEYSKMSYAGGIAGIVAIYDEVLNRAELINYDQINQRTANIKLIKVGGELSITAEKVGGLFGYLNEDAYIINSQFDVSVSNNQRLKGYYLAGGLVGEYYGAMNLCKVEIESKSVEAYDKALTNLTGESLFTCDTNPVYIGGLVGVSYGGLISTSYSKTNVLHFNATYAGGLVGYGTNNSKQGYKQINGEDVQDADGNKIQLYRPTKLIEVYSTGNVFAGASYNAEITKIEDKDGTTVITRSATANNVAGGIFGKLDIKFTEGDYIYDVVQEDNSYKFTNMLGVLGLNGFYKPYSYNIESTYGLAVDPITYLNPTTVTYGHIAGGFTGQTTLSSGSIQNTCYDAVVGAFAGKISVDDSLNNAKISFKLNTDYKYNNMFTPFAYNASTITTAICANASGKVLNMVADKTNGIKFSDCNTYNIQEANTNLSGTQVTIDFDNKDGKNYFEGNQQTKIKIAPNNAYLLYRSENYSFKISTQSGVLTYNYANFVQNFDGIYNNWNHLSWKPQSPVYPKFVEKDTSGYVLIYTEEDLQKINNYYSHYLLVADIFLTKPFTPISTFSGSFESAIRTDEAGLKVNGVNSQYYTIYNININYSPTANENLAKEYKEKSFGLFSDIDKATIKNINFVFGTKIKDPTKQYDNTDSNNKNNWYWHDENNNDLYPNYNGVTIKSTADTFTIGSLVGNATESTITNCNIYYANQSKLSVEGKNITASMFVGKSTNSKISGSIRYGNNKNNSDIYDYGGIRIQPSADGKTYSAEFKEVKNALNTPTLDVKYGKDSEILNIGSAIGFVDQSEGIDVSGQYNYVNVVQSGSIATSNTVANIGGYIGKITVSNDDEGVANISSSYINNSQLDVTGHFKTLNIGGYIGSAEKTLFTLAEIKTIKVNATDCTIADLVNVGGVIGYSKNSTITMQNIAETVAILSNYTSLGLNMGGVIGAIDGTSVSGEEVVVKKSSIVANSDEDTHLLNVGGFVGCATINFATISNITLQEVIIDAQAVVTEDENNENGNATVGGFIGQGDNIEIHNNIVELFNLSSNNIPTVDNNLSIGGFGGHINTLYSAKEGIINGKNCYVKSINFNLTDLTDQPANLYIGGFAGRGHITLIKGLSKGSITLPDVLDDDKYVYVGGFISQAQKYSGGGSARLENCFADVKILVATSNDNLHLAAFAHICSAEDDKVALVVISNCVALGDIVYKSDKAHVFRGSATGFIDYSTTTTSPTGYTLSTIKLISKNNSNITADFFDVRDGRAVPQIKFSYNLSATVNFNGPIDNDSDNIKEDYIYTYTELLQLVNKLLVQEKSGVKTSNDKFITDIYCQDATDFKFISGTKLAPIEFTTNTEVESDKYYVAKQDVTKTLSSINYNLIADDYKTGVVLTRTQSNVNGETLTIASKGFISGIIIKDNIYNETSYIETNNGYIFNCLVVSTPNADGVYHKDGFASVGFVETNLGLINACGTTANISGASHATGFVYENECLIANSFANGVIHNITSNMTYAGFVFVNNGSIFNSYASTTMFNRNTADDTVKYSKCYGFIYDNQNENSLANCYYDTSSTSAATQTVKGVTAKSREDLCDDGLINKLAIRFVKLGSDLEVPETNKTTYYNEKLPSTLSYLNQLSQTIVSTKDANNNDKITITATIKNVKALQELFELISKSTTTSSDNVFIDIKLLTSIDATLLGDKNINRYLKSIKLSATKSTYININSAIITDIEDVDDNTQVITYQQNIVYNATISTSLLTAKHIQINDFGLYVSYFDVGNNDNIKVYINGVLVQRVHSLITNNTFVVLQKDITLTNDENFGILAGQIDSKAEIVNTFTSGNITVQYDERYQECATGNMIGYVYDAYINNSFSTGDITINSSADQVEYGHLIGDQSGSKATITNVFSSGTITIKKDVYNQNIYVGGLVGSLNATEVYTNKTKVGIADSYSNVTIKNLTTINYDNNSVKVGAVVGYINAVTANTLCGASVDNLSLQEALKFVDSNNKIKDDFVANNYHIYLLNFDSKAVPSSGFSPNPDIGGGPIMGDGINPPTLPDILPNVHYTVTVAYLIYLKNLNVYVNSGISLVDNYIGGGSVDIDNNGTDDINLSTIQIPQLINDKEALFEVNAFGESFNVTRHFAIQDVFKNNQYAINALDIKRTEETGSRMSPIDYYYINKFSDNHYYHVSADKITGSSGNYTDDKRGSLDNITIYGRGNSIILNSNSQKLFRVLTNSTFTNLIIQNAILVDNSDGILIAKNCTTKGSVSDTQSAFVNSIENAYLINCTVNLTKWVTSNHDKVGGLIANIDNSDNNDVYILSPTINMTSILLSNDTNYVGGIISNPTSYSNVKIIDPTIYNLQVAHNSTFTSYTEMGGISAYINVTENVELIGNVYIDNQIGANFTNTNQNYQIGLLYSNVNLSKTNGDIDENNAILKRAINLTSRSNEIIVSTTINVSDSGNGDGSLYVGAFGQITDYQENYGYSNISLSKLTISKPLTFKLNSLGAETPLNQLQSGYSTNSIKNIYAGAIAGHIGGTNNYKNITLTDSSKLRVNIKQSQYNYVGGIAGTVTNKALLTNVTKNNFDVNVQDLNSSSITYVGGIAGSFTTSEVLTGLDNIYGLTAATSAATSAPETKQVKDIRTWSVKTSKAASLTKYTYILDSSENNIAKTTKVVLSVGGLFGYTDNPKTDYTEKNYGPVRALLTGSNDLENGLRDTTLVKEWDFGYLFSRFYFENNLTGTTINSDENIQCRAGGVAGLVKGSEKDTEDVSRVSAGSNINKSLNMDWNDNCFDNGNYEEFNRLDERKTAYGRSELSKSNIDITNIFDSSKGSDYTVLIQDFDDAKETHKLQDNTWARYAYWLGSNTDFTSNNKTTTNTVFAGYLCEILLDNTRTKVLTYNRSIWMNVRLVDKGIFGANPSGNYLDIYAHWAGDYYGAELV